MFDIQENLKKLPDEPGVYLHKDKLGQIIYVGKAVSLKKRVRQYFQSSKNMDPKVRAMVANIEEFEYIRCGSEMEALVLENNLIKKYQPKYNILLRDDKTYPYICVTADKWPRIIKTRRILKDGAKYFGPYSDVGAVNSMVDLLNSVYRIKKCSASEFPEGFRPCLNYHIGQCDGICTGKADHGDYMNMVEEAVKFLRGKQSDLLSYLKEQMNEASENLDFENAARYRDYIIAAKALTEKQRVTLSHGGDMDLILYAGRGYVTKFLVRDGKLIGRDTFDMKVPETEEAGNVIEAFIKQHYGQMPEGPSEILLSKDLEDREILQEFLSQCWGKKVSINVPVRGEKKAFMEMALRDTMELTDSIEEKEKNKKERAERLRTQIGDVIAKAKVGQPSESWVDEETGEIISLLSDTKNRDYRVEAYDISNINGVDNVGVMVVYEGLKPIKKAYRKFRIKTVDGADDYASMREVIARRVKRGLSGDKTFLPLPDLMLIDGGKGHVQVVRETLESLGVEIAVTGMAKDDFHRTRALVYCPQSAGGNGEFVEEELKGNGMLFGYIGGIQEEVHRFAIDYHRGKRRKGMLKSALDDIPGIGPKKRTSLMNYFGNIEKIKEASAEELLKVPGITQANAQAIVNFFIDKKGD